MNKPSRFQAAGVSAALSLLFVTVYSTCNWITSQRTGVGAWFYPWERHIPFVPLMIVPYMSIDLFFVAAPFLCATRNELLTFARRISFAIIAAGICFLLFPLQFGMPRPEPAGWTGAIFKMLHGFDQPYNLCPSLHITLRTILAALYIRHSHGAVKWTNRIWFSLIGFSTLLTYQHHVVDVIGGFILAGFCFYLIREEPIRLPVVPNFKVARYYALGAILTSALAIRGWPWTGILFWPVAALTIVAAAYVGIGPGIYRKANSRIPFTARVLLAPCLLGQQLSLLHYRRSCTAWNRVLPNLWIGARLNPREALQLRNTGVTAVLDLTAEFSEVPELLTLEYWNLPILDLTAPTQDQLREAVAFIRRHAANGIVYVHCKIGYSRTAAIVGACLLDSGLTANVPETVSLLRNARPGIIIRPEVISALNEFASNHPRNPAPLATPTTP